MIIILKKYLFYYHEYFRCASLGLFRVVGWNDCYLPTLIQIPTSDIMNYNALKNIAILNSSFVNSKMSILVI